MNFVYNKAIFPVICYFVYNPNYQLQETDSLTSSLIVLYAVLKLGRRKMWVCNLVNARVAQTAYIAAYYQTL